MDPVGFREEGQAPARLGFPGALPQRRVVWMWFGALSATLGGLMLKLKLQYCGHLMCATL